MRTMWLIHYRSKSGVCKVFKGFLFIRLETKTHVGGKCGLLALKMLCFVYDGILTSKVCDR